MKKYLVPLNLILIFWAFFSSEKSVAQLGFCSGNSGDPIFTETFGTGTTNTTLPAGTTTYSFTSGFPDDGFYTVRNGSFGNAFDWHQTSDHTTGDVNGKFLIVNAGFSAGEFYNTTISGLCETTTYEFSSWLLNLVIAGSFCSTQPGGSIPVNVRFEIWDSTDTNLLASGDTGNITDTSSPNWQQFGLVFQTLPGQTDVNLKMINNGVGGCGNDIAIDDIVFRSCGDTVTIDDATSNNNVTICSSQTPYITTLTVTPDNSVFSSHFYQWEESTDGITWTDIVGETAQTISLTGINATEFYRAKVAELASNLNNTLCNVTSDTFQVTVNQLPAAPTHECWETATINDLTCSWEVTGMQPTQPTGLECWEVATFNNVTCLWEVTGTQPAQPTLECWETANFNNTTCVWDVTGTQPTQPTLECWETAAFNNATCVWDITGTQPVQPTLECWETATFNNTTCVWEVSGDQPLDTVDEFVSFCDGEMVTLQANTTISNPTYTWNTGEMTSFLVIDTEGIYTVEVTDGCSTTIITFTVEEIEIPIIESITSNGNDIIVMTSNTGNFLHALDGINYQSNNIFANVEGGLYTIYVKTNDCDTVVTSPFIHFYVPQFFTPNGDTENETWDLNGIENYNTSEVQVFDRYGKLLKSTKNAPFSWDGTFNNNPLPTSDYWYVIVIDGQRRIGHFTLKR